MERHPVELTGDEYERLNSTYPESEGSGLIGKRAEEIVKIYQDAYPSISRKEARGDLEDLTSQGLCAKEVSEEGGDCFSYSLLPVERWSAEHQRAYGVTTYPW